MEKSDRNEDLISNALISKLVRFGDYELQSPDYVPSNFSSRLKQPKPKHAKTELDQNKNVWKSTEINRMHPSYSNPDIIQSVIQEKQQRSKKKARFNDGTSKKPKFNDESSSESEDSSDSSEYKYNNLYDPLARKNSSFLTNNNQK